MTDSTTTPQVISLRETKYLAVIPGCVPVYYSRELTTDELNDLIRNGYEIYSRFPAELETNQETNVESRVLRLAGFRTELTELINKYSLEDGSDTPDGILAGFLCGCLESFERALHLRHQQMDIDKEESTAKKED